MPVPSPRRSESDIRAAPRLQWRDRAGIGPASRAQTRTDKVTTCRRRFLGLEPGAAVNARRCAPLLILALAASLGGCAGSPRANASPAHAPRIVALMPSFAEDLCAIGAGADIVGVSEYGKSGSCARTAPAVANFASVDAEKIVALHPDAVVGIPAQRILTAPLRRAGIATVFLRDESYADIFADVRQLGALSDRRAQAQALIAKMQARTRQLQSSEHFKRSARVFVVLQAQPIWTVGPQSYISTLLRMAGARNAVTQLPRPYAQYSAEALIALQPDAIVAGSDTQLQLLLTREPWRSLRAVRDRHVFILPDPGLLERPGPRYNEGLSWLIERLRPLST